MSDEISTQLRQWRDAVAANRGLTADDVDELEDHLLAEYQDLSALGLSSDEALLVAKHRLGSVAEVASEYLQAHPDRAWEQLPAARTGAGKEAARQIDMAVKAAGFFGARGEFLIALAQNSLKRVI